MKGSWYQVYYNGSFHPADKLIDDADPQSVFGKRARRKAEYRSRCPRPVTFSFATYLSLRFSVYIDWPSVLTLSNLNLHEI